MTGYPTDAQCKPATLIFMANPKLLYEERLTDYAPKTIFEKIYNVITLMNKILTYK